MKNIVLLSLVSLAFVSCKPDDVIGTGRKTSYYINGYIEADEIVGVPHENVGLIGMDFIGEEYLPYPANDPLGADFREISERYGDTHCYRKIYTGSPDALCNEFTGIDVVSDTDFNDIPAGASLGGVVELLAASAKPYLDSVYKDTYNWVECTPEDYIICGTSWGTAYDGFHPVYGPLHDLSPDQLILLMPYWFYLKFLSEPVLKHHTFTITFHEAGRSMSCEVKYNF